MTETGDGPVPQALVAGDMVLRRFTTDDLPALLAAFADPLIRTWNPGPPDDGADRGRGALSWLEGRNAWDASHASWAVSDPAGNLLGSVSLPKIDHDQLDAEIGYWLAPGARDRGLGRLAVIMASRFGFEQLGLLRNQLLHAVANRASCRLATAAGFALEGHLRRSHRFADGLHHDEHLHACLASDHC